MSLKRILAAAAIVALAATLGAQPARGQNSEGIAAIVNDDVISTYDVRQRAQLLLVSAGMHATPELMQRASIQALRDLIDEHLQLQETRGDPYHINITDAEVDRRLADIARSNNTTVAEFQTRLTQAGVNIATLRSQLRADIAWNRLMGGLYGSRIRVSESEVRDTQARIAANATSAHYQISEIFLPASTPQEFAQAQDGAMRLLEQMQQTAFPLVARQFSAAPSAANGGDIGWIAENELPAEIGAVARNLQPGQVSLPIRTPTGVYIIALRDKQNGQPQGAASQVALRQISAPANRRRDLERLQRRISGCTTIDRDVAAIQGAELTDLGETVENALAPDVRARITNVAAGSASPVEENGEQVSMLVVCSRETGGAGVPSRQEIESRLFEQELSMLSERYLRNLRREATVTPAEARALMR